MIPELVILISFSLVIGFILCSYTVHGQEAVYPMNVTNGKVYYEEKHIVITVGSEELVWCVKGNPMKPIGVCNSGEIKTNMSFIEMSELIEVILNDGKKD